MRSQVQSEDLEPKDEGHPIAGIRSWREAVPLLTSLTFHAAIATIGLLAYHTISRSVTHVDQSIIAVTDFQSDVQPGASDASMPHAPNPDQTLSSQNDVDLRADDWRPPGSAPAMAVLTSDSAQFSPAFPRNPVGPAGSNLATNGRGTSGASGSGEGSQFARFGQSNTIGTGFLQDKKPARSVVFVCDGSGSMQNKIGALKNELNRTVQKLRPTQAFDLIFFCDPRVVALDHSLLIATPEHKRRAADFLSDVTASGSTDPIPALKLAFAQKPELIYLLTDGDFPDNAAVRAEIRRLNPHALIRVNTIAFVESAAGDEAFTSFLSQLARDNGGSATCVKVEDLQ